MSAVQSLARPHCPGIKRLDYYLVTWHPTRRHYALTPRHDTSKRSPLCISAQQTPSATAPTLGNKNNNNNGKTPWIIKAPLLLATITAVGACILTFTGALSPLSFLATARTYLASSVLARSGFFAAFSLIFASELGDKTFFIAALLAMKLGKWISFTGSVAALSLMTVISVTIGVAVKAVPTVVESSEAWGQWLGAILLAYFGLKTLKDAWMSPSGAGDELEEAEESVLEAEQGGRVSVSDPRGGNKWVSPWKALLQVASLIFVAEWGDRSMLATIALGAAQSPAGVAGGAIAGHAAATLIAVIGGAVLSDRISEKTVGYVGGVLFLVFAVATVLGLF
jgi:putative Ca2+/H+ antiporter (TMEM165/GDT1 family)